MKVPHIHEMILLSLDYKTFKKCGGVCKTWDELLASESFCKKAYSAYKEEMDLELLTYAKEGQIDNIKRLLTKGVNPNVNIRRKSPLHWGILGLHNGHMDVIKVLLDHGADINAATEMGTTPLLASLRLNHSEGPDKDIVALLLKRGADPNKTGDRGKTPLHVAAIKGDIGVVKELLDLGGYNESEDMSRYTPLGWAILKGHTEVEKLIKKAGATNEQ